MENEMSNETETLASISVRDVKRDVWRDFKKLAVVHDMTLQDYLEYVVNKEMANVQIQVGKQRE